ncbi:RluA family pseudouridine synthase [Leptolyngbya sp. FACHB-671]|uniref:RluA family pseudouridine synthase n=1 Tax=Leptolyngbya sp. FACHB-671 TaxID=2692812 RepID=UPI0016869E05|nr:RluA family pseudouridine synthase [Leptolyngbya sp. FACHB-671]
MNEGWTYCDRINRDTESLSVLDYYTQRYQHSSRTEWEQRIESGQVLLNGVPATATAVLQAGNQLTYHRPPWQEPEVPLEFAVLHEDADLLVIAKPSGLPVLPGGGFLQNTLLWQLQQRYLDSPPVPIHRLGRGTSGLMLLARSPSARASLSQQMRDRQIRKTYRALASGTTMSDRFTITQPIGKIPYPLLGYLYAATPDGPPAHSECCVLRRNENNTLLEVTILTGRPHQIRIHLAASGFPLVGDPLYGVGGVPLSSALADSGSTTHSRPIPGDCGYHLHALQLSFVHPTTGQPVSYTCPAPSALS